MRTCLVTGGAGFIGSHMADRLLRDGYRVIVVDNESTGRRANVPATATYVRGDVTRVGDLREPFELGVDVVFHIAGQASIFRSFADPHQDLAVNVTGTINVVQLCLAYRVPRLLFASSMTAYGDTQAVPIPITEPCVPSSYYGITKYAAERYVMATGARRDLDYDFGVTALRMFNVYGERQRLDNPYQGVMGFFVGSGLRRAPIEIHGDGQQTRDFIYIDDVVDAWMAAVDCPPAHGKVFNVGMGEGVGIRRLAEEVVAACGEEPARYPWRSGPLRPGDQRHTVADISATRAALGWQPQVELRDGLARTIAWAREELKKP